MPEHVHIIIRLNLHCYEISAILKAMKQPVARRSIKHFEAFESHWLPRITRRRGAPTERLFWQSRGWFDGNIPAPTTLWRMFASLHMNLFGRGRVERSVDWLWSSACWFEEVAKWPLLTDKVPPEWVPLGDFATL